MTAATLPWATRAPAPTRTPGHRMVAVYVRISADDKGDTLGVRRQHKLCEAMDPATGDPVTYVVFCDNNKSASDGTYRPDFQDLVGRWLPSGCIDEIRVYMQKRFWRLLEEGEDVRRACQRANLEVIRCVRDGDTTFTGNGRTMARFRSMMDTDYAETLSQLQRDKKRELALAGKPLGGGHRPFGYMADRLQADPVEFAHLREAITRLLNGGNVSDVCRDWNERGIVTPAGNVWRPQALINCLTSPRIAGLSHHLGEIVGEAQWPAVVDRKTWNALVARLSIKNPHGRKNARLLSGLAVCGVCGTIMVGCNNNGTKSYACKNGIGQRGCGSLRIVADKVEALLVDELLSRTDKAKAKAARTLTARGDVVVDVEALTARKSELATMFARGVITGAQLMAGTEDIDRQLGHAAASSERAAAAAVLVPYLTRPGRLRDEWTHDKLDDQAKRAILHAALESVTIAPAERRGQFDHRRVQPVWNI